MNQNPLITIADWHGRNGQDFEATVIREAVDRIDTLEAQLDRAMELVGGCPKDKGLRCSGAGAKKCGPCITGYVMEGK